MKALFCITIPPFQNKTQIVPWVWLGALYHKTSVNSLSPGIHIEILQTDLHTFP